MFNAYSCKRKLRAILAKDFQKLENFTNVLYEDYGLTCIKEDDGTWVRIPVEEDFAQGCPMSPIFAAIVLRSILIRIEKELHICAKMRLQ